MYKVEVGSVLYKAGIRWTEYNESEFTVGEHDRRYMVLDQLINVYILTISLIILVVFMITIIDHPVTLVMLITSQVLGHKNIISYAIDQLHLLNMNEVKMKEVFMKNI